MLLCFGCESGPSGPSTEIGEIAVGPAPTGISPVGDWIAVSEIAFDFGTLEFGEARISWIDPRTDSVQSTTRVGVNPQRVLAVGANRDLLGVICTGDYGPNTGLVQVLQPETGSLIHEIPVGGQPVAAVAGQDDLLFLGSYAQSGIAVVDVWTGTLLQPWDDSAGFDVAALARGGNGIVAVDFDDDLLIDLDETGFVLNVVPVGDGPVALCTDPSDAQRIYILHGLDETIGVVDLGISVFSRFPEPAGHAPNDIQMHEGMLWVVASLSNSVNLWDPADGTSLGAFHLGTNRNPMQIAFWGEQAYVSNLLANTVSVLPAAGAPE